MKIALVVRPMLTRRPFHALKQIESVLRTERQKSYDLLLFPQAYLQGIYGIEYQLEAALKTALFIDSKPIKKLQALCKKYLVGIGIGFYEKDENLAIYDSYVIINRQGQIRHLQRQLTVHWLEQADDEQKIALQYDDMSEKDKDLMALNAEFFDSKALQEMEEEETDFAKEESDASDADVSLENAVGFSRAGSLEVGYFGGKRVVVLIGDDFMQQEIIIAALELEPQLVLCPTSLAYGEAAWQEKYFERYQNQARKFNCPVLLVNSLNKHDEFLKGGAWIWQGQKMLGSLQPTEESILDLEIE